MLVEQCALMQMVLFRKRPECALFGARVLIRTNTGFSAAGVVPCGGLKKSPRTSSIVQIIFFF